MARIRVSGVARVTLFVLVSLALGGSASGQVLCRAEADDIAALRTFDRAVAAYVDLHRRLEPGLMSLRISSDAEALAAASDRLADAIRYERQAAGPGEFFTPEVADLFRVRLAASGLGAIPDVPWAFDEEFGECPLPVVNGRPGWMTRPFADEAVRHVLPPLPLELEYWLIGRTLILMDVRANLVLDVLDDALP